MQIFPFSCLCYCFEQHTTVKANCVQRTMILNEKMPKTIGSTGLYSKKAKQISIKRLAFHAFGATLGASEAPGHRESIHDGLGADIGSLEIC